MITGIELSSQAAIKETIPSASERYDDRHAGQAKRRIVPLGPLDVRNGDNEASHPFGPVPNGWIEYTHVIEGIPYFYNPQTRVVTDAYIRIPAILSTLEVYYAQIAQVLQSLDSTELMLSTMDIYINPTCDPQTGQRIGMYYLVDHRRHSIAFLRPIDTGGIGLPDVRSTIHLERVWRSEYWTHCEYMPRPDVDHTESARKLQGQLGALIIDNISSEGSTSPFTPQECEHYLKGVNPNINEPQFLNWSVARVNSLLIQSQIINLHGEKWARADRTMIVTGQRPPARTAFYLQLSKYMFDCPATHLDRLEHAWADRIIYSHYWKKLLKELVEEWAVAAGVASLVWVANMVLFTTTSSTVPLLLLGVSTISTVYGIVKALLLIRKHRSLGQYAIHGSQYLQANEKYGTGLQDLSFEFSYPWACTLWAGALTSTGVLWMILSQVGRCILGFISVGFISPHILCTVALMLGAWAYGRGAAEDAKKLVSSTKPSSHVQYVIRTK
ncbi:unnamed protein product [Rhizoctonia solani]|uniref:Uncharacterized protein n=1 Tax=Rhizoctonia solani TaxID=456999 RepID=A0A8H3I202_9AGAM|nr:unnamed protein product [Rhizoctonia solani]CAE7169473.1 unnamed protein product [Rhizoctonia solani]